MPEPRPTFVFSVDVECWGQSVLDRSLPIRAHAADNVRRMLELLAESDGARGTFFVLGKFAERHPDVVREICRAGHEIGSHGYGHVEVTRMTPEAFRADLRRADEIIAGIVGRRPLGYRAPAFSIGSSNLWALRVLAEEGYEYDSSVYPFAGPRYGIGDWPREASRVYLPDGLSIIEYPLTTLTVGGRRWPISGGGYARLLPAFLLWRMFRHERRRRETPPAFYCHPYEIDAGELRRYYPGLPLKRRLHQGLGRRGFLEKLRRMLGRFHACAFTQAIAAAGTEPGRSISWGARRLGDHRDVIRLSSIGESKIRPQPGEAIQVDSDSKSSSSSPGTSIYSRQLGHSATEPASEFANETVS
jgi:polysaccharide deacetylase family protein (PEP-CTERM system associated)